MILDSGHGRSVIVGGRRLTLFSTNNYLGLAGHASLKRAARDAIRRYGAGAGAARGTTGTLRVHRLAERALAGFEGREDAVLFPSGYMAMIAAIEGLAEDGGVVVCDELDHPSVAAGCRVARIEALRYRHCDPGDLRTVLRRMPGRRALVVSSSVFALTGDAAPLREIASVADAERKRFLVDEAHGTGVLGRTGRGGVEEHGIETMVCATMGTLSKALGGVGGFVAGSREVAGRIRARATTFKYTTAPSPVTCAVAVAAIRLLREDERLLTRLRKNRQRLSTGLQRIGIQVPQAHTPIFPLWCDTPRGARSIAARLFRNGYLVAALGPPLVGHDRGLVRMTVSACHTRGDIDGLVDALEKAL
jgi:8-amino-7-oxononanoate synthase